MNRSAMAPATLYLALTAIFATLILGSRNADASAWRAAVDPWVLETAVVQGETEFLVLLSEQADLGAADALPSKLEKGAFVYRRLTEVAERTQRPVIKFLESAGAKYKSYWVANMLWVEAEISTLRSLAARPDVAHIYANPQVPLDSPTIEMAAPSLTGIEWNLALVNADDVWAQGITGQGVVIGGQDTGYDWDHPALVGQYRGWNGSSADHNYSWHDAIHGGSRICGPDSPEPCDDHGHGTHTMGTMVGDDGGGNQIGMAPGARWIGCRNMDRGVGTPATYSECYQWFIAPTDLSDKNPDPSKAPHVINNSWSCPPSEGCTDPNVLLTVVNNVRAAGILTVHSAGNSGSSCSTVDAPAAIYDASFTVGATSANDLIALFSSRGPVTVDGSNRFKPDISAPGVNIRSSVPGGGYQAGWNGTSMAAPHVAGLAALLISAEPRLAGEVDYIETVVEQTAVPLTTTQGCGGDGPSEVPNHVYGWGRVDAWAAYRNVPHFLALQKVASSSSAAPDAVLAYTLTVTHSHTVSVTDNLILTDALPAQTVFISATDPYSITGNVVQWSKANLPAHGVWEVQLVVQVSPSASGIVTNDRYGVKSDQVTTVSGSPVELPIFHYAYLPIIAPN